jgi:hypothetical protein
VPKGFFWEQVPASIASTQVQVAMYISKAQQKARYTGQQAGTFTPCVSHRGYINIPDIPQVAAITLEQLYIHISLSFYYVQTLITLHKPQMKLIPQYYILVL